MQEADHQPSQLSRVISFSDSVFAFAITLMVIIFPFQNLPEADAYSSIAAAIYAGVLSLINLLNPFVALVLWTVGWLPAYFVRVRGRKSSSKGDE
jgi:uncharacterized membrane protein